MAKENKKVKNSVLIDLFYEDGLRTGDCLLYTSDAADEL